MTNNAWNTAFSTANGQLLIGDTGNNPVWSTLTEGAAVTITEGAGSIEIDFDSAGGDCEFIASATASGSASITFTDLSSSYSSYIVEMQGVQPATDGVQLWLRTSTDNGSNYDDGGSDYIWSMWTVHDGGSDGEGDTSDSKIILLGTPGEELGTASGETSSGTLRIFDPSSSNYTRFCFNGSFTEDSSYHASMHEAGMRLSTTAVDAIEFSMSAGNIATGNFKLYGFKA